MGTELERRAKPSIEESFRVAKGFAMSGYFSDAKSAEQAFVKVMAGAEMGLSPFQAMTGIHIIEGKPVVGAALLAALIDQHPDYEFAVEWEPDEKDPVACTVVIFKSGTERGRSRFSLEDATAAGIDKPTSSGKLSNWKKFGRNMLYARAMSNAVRWYAPGVTGTATYTDEQEIADDVVPPHISALDAKPAVTVVDVVPNVSGYVNPDDPMDDVPFIPENAAPAAPPAESPTPSPGPVAAEEPAGTGSPGGLFIETVGDAERLVNALNAEQLGVMRKMMKLDAKASRRVIADALLTSYPGWDSQDVLVELSGWAS